MKLRKVTAIITAAVMMMSLAACGSSDKEGGSDGGSSSGGSINVIPGRKDPEQEGHSLSFSVWKKK